MGVVSDFFTNLDFGSFIQGLYTGGWYHFVFPLLLVYAIIFTILNNVELFKDKKPVKVIIAMVFAFFAIAFPITGDSASCGLNTSIGTNVGCETLGDLMMVLFPGVTAFAIGILGLYIVISIMGYDLMNFFGEDEKNKAMLRYILGGLGFFVVIYYYARGFGWLGFGGASPSTWGIFQFFADPFLYILIIFGLLFYWITKDD